MKPRFATRNRVACTALSIVFTLASHAATVTKSASGTDLTDGATSWGGAVPTSADTATWTATSLGAALTLNAAADWQGIAVTGALSNIDISGTGALTLGTAGIDLAASSVDLSIGNAVTLNGNQTWKAAASKNIGISGSVGGTGNLTAGAAAPTSTYSAGYLSANSGTPTTVFPGATLANFSAANGVMQGGWIPTATSAAGYFFTNNGTTATVQLQFYDGTTYTKVAKVQLTQVGADVVAYQIYGKFKTGNLLGQNFDSITSEGSPPVGSGGYGVNSLTVSIGSAASGTVSLSGNNNYTGTSTVNVGTLAVAGGNAIPDASAVTISSGATLLLNANEAIGSLAGAGNGNLQGKTPLPSALTTPAPPSPARSPAPAAHSSKPAPAP